jgi:hypothetical protein
LKYDAISPVQPPFFFLRKEGVAEERAWLKRQSCSSKAKATTLSAHISQNINMIITIGSLEEF